MIRTKKEAYELGFKNGMSNHYLPYNMEDQEIIDEYDRGYDEGVEQLEMITKFEQSTKIAP